ncbi:MAG TPA: ABC-2 transporter permease [Candidatus Faecousia faecavium]|nr:ABC-2 transporter permease [Candidatus Faecousia faecavium]
MKGLLLKDWYMVVKYCKAYLLICLVFIGVSIMSDDNFFFILYPCILCGMIPVTLLGYDERSKWDQYCAALPYTKAQIVSGKYLLGMGTQIGMLLLSAVIQVIRMRVSGAFSWKSFSSILSMLAILSFLTPAISLPPMFRWGVEKGRMAYYISVGLVCGISAFVVNVSDITLLGFLPNSAAMLLLGLASLVAYGISWYLSILFYQKREG